MATNNNSPIQSPKPGEIAGKTKGSKSWTNPSGLQCPPGAGATRNADGTWTCTLNTRETVPPVTPNQIEGLEASGITATGRVMNVIKEGRILAIVLRDHILTWSSTRRDLLISLEGDSGTDLLTLSFTSSSELDNAVVTLESLLNS